MLECPNELLIKKKSYDLFSSFKIDAFLKLRENKNVENNLKIPVGNRPEKN